MAVIPGTSIEWEYSEGAITLTGTGSIPNYAVGLSNRPPWEQYIEQITHIVIGDGITVIGDYAFYGYNNVVSITMADSVLHIGDGAFFWCLNKTDNGSVRFPENLCVIGQSAFANALGLKTFTMPPNVTTLGITAFQNTGLQKVEINDRLAKIEGGAFHDCSDLSVIVLGRGLTAINNYAFLNDTKLTTVINHSSLVLVRGSDTYGGVAKYSNALFQSVEDVTVYDVVFYASRQDMEDGVSYSTMAGIVATYRGLQVIPFPDIRREGFTLTRWKTDDYDEYNVYLPDDSLTLQGRSGTNLQTLKYFAEWERVPTVLMFNLQGGRSGPGMLSRVSDTSVTFSIPSTVPIRAGYIFGGWSEYVGGIEPVGSTVTVSPGETKTLYAQWRKNDLEWSSQGESFLPYCGIRIWKDEAAYFNATFYQVVEGNGLAVVSKAENRPGSAKFTLINDYDVVEDRLLSDTFSHWSDGSAGAIEPGMFVELFNIESETRATLIMDGYITTITPDAEVITFEVADQITMASKSGSFLRRNYRRQDSASDGYFDMSVHGSDLVKDFSNDGTVLKAFVLDTDPTEREAGALDKSQWGRKKCGTVIGTLFAKNPSNTRPRRAIVKIEYDWKQTTKQRDYQDRTLSFTVKVRSDGKGGFEQREVKVKKIHTPKGSTSTNYYAGDFTMEIPLTGGPNDSLGNNVSVEVNVKQNFPEGDDYIRSGGGTFFKWVKLVFDNQVEVTPAQVITIPNASGEQLADPTGRVYVNLHQKGAEVNSLKIMEDMAEAMGWGFPKNVSDEDGATLSLYRVGGAYVQDYLQKLADMTSGRTGARLSYEIRGQSPSLYVGKRYSVSDSPLMTIAYGGDIDTVPEAIPFSACSVGITFKNRPNLVTLKGTCSDGDGSKSVTLTVENPSSTLRRGMLIESIVSDTNASSVGEIGKTAYASLMASEVDQWEGTVTIPGIVLSMSEGVTARAGSGIPVHLFDSRIHLDTVVRVKQVEYNYNECNTKLTVGNYNAIYSNAIREANALAVTVSDAVGAVADTTLYDNQSVYVKKDARWTVEAGAKAYARRTDDNAWVELGTPTIYELPAQEYIDTDGTVKTWTWYLVNITCKADAVTCTRHEYGINAIRLGNSLVLDIPEKRRPDFYYGQTLSVCAMVRKN